MGSLGVTDTKARAYVGWPHLFDATNQHQYDVLLERGLKPEHELLDVGAGCLGVGRALIDYLEPWHYWAVEPQSWLIRSSNVPRNAYHLYQFDDWKLSCIGHEFDYVLVHSIFTHADRATICLILSEAHQVLAEDGLLCASFHDCGGDSVHEGWSYPAGVSYTGKFIMERANEAEFISGVVVDKRHPAGHSWLFGRKR